MKPQQLKVLHDASRGSCYLSRIGEGRGRSWCGGRGRGRGRGRGKGKVLCMCTNWCSGKQLLISEVSNSLELDILIQAEGAENGMKFTIVRPFNWIGSRMDFIPRVRVPHTLF